MDEGITEYRRIIIERTGWHKYDSGIIEELKKLSTIKEMETKKIRISETWSWNVGTYHLGASERAVGIRRMPKLQQPASEPAIMAVLEEEWFRWWDESSPAGPVGVDEGVVTDVVSVTDTGAVLLLKRGLKSSALLCLFRVYNRDLSARQTYLLLPLDTAFGVEIPTAAFKTSSAASCPHGCICMGGGPSHREEYKSFSEPPHALSCIELNYIRRW